MTSVFETVRNIPLIEKDEMAVDDSGFPFDRDFDRDDRDDHLRSQLDDLAQRHPEFAEHLEGFPFRSDSLGRRSRPPRPSDETEFRRFAGRPFGSSRFERFGFPFNSRDPFDDEETKPHPEAPSQEKETTPKKETQETQTQTPERGRRQNIQQSNTVDLGQKQEPVNDRNQRSMSAPPPDNRSGQQRFVSSINIPINRDGGMGDMGTQQSQPQEKPSNKPTERVIPIHVEGRDEPVMPKHTGPSYSQPQPQPERIFGHRPSQFTQYVGRESPRPFATGSEWHQPVYSRQEPTPTEQMKQYQQQQQQKFQQQQQQVPPQEQVPPPAPPQQQPTPQQQPKSSACTAIDTIQSIQKDVSELMGQVEKFSGMPRDKQYLYLDEMLTRNLIKLDNVDTQGQENIRQARKEAIKCIESCIGILEAKAAANVPQEKRESKEEEKVELQPAVLVIEESQPTEEKMEVEVKEKEEIKVEEPQQPTEEKMEVVGEAVTNEETTKIDESSQKETTDKEIKEVPEETKQESGEVTKEEASHADESTEKKKGKKKVVKN